MSVILEPMIAMPDLEEAERMKKARHHDIEAREEALKRLQNFNWNWYASGMSFERVKNAIRRQLDQAEMWSPLYAYYFNALCTMVLVEREWVEQKVEGRIL